MKQLTILVGAIAMLALATIALAQPPGGPGGAAMTPNYSALVGASDVIVLGGVVTADIPALPTTAVGGGMGGPGGMGGTTGEATITFKVEKAMLGTTDAGTLTLKVPLSIAGGGRPGGGGTATTVAAWTPDVSAGKKLILGLVKTQAGLALPQTANAMGGGPGGMMGGMMGGGSSSIIDAAQATAVADAIAKFPIKVTLAAPTAPLIIGSKASFTVTVKNTGTDVLTLQSVKLSSLADSSKLTAGATFTVVADDIKDAAGANRTIAAGADATISVIMTVVGPINYQAFDTKLFPLTSQLSASVTVTAPAAAAGGAGGPGGGGFARVTMTNAKSPWVAASVALK